MPDVAAEVAGATPFERALVKRLPVHFTPVCERWFVGRSFMRKLQGGTEWHRNKSAHRPSHAHAEVVGVLVVALAAVPREWAALLREEAAPATRRSRRGRLEGTGRQRCVQEVYKEHCEERRRHSALEPISTQIPAAQRLLRKLAEALI
jgi:hypothetical protein